MMEDKIVLTAGGRKIVYYTFPTPPNYKVLVLQASGWRNVYYIIQGSVMSLNSPEVMNVLCEVFRPHFTFFFSTVNDMKLREAKLGKDTRMVWIGEATTDINTGMMEIPQGRETGGIWLYREIVPYKLVNVKEFEDNQYYIYSDINAPTTICTRISGKWYALSLDKSKGTLITTPFEKIIGSKSMLDGNPPLSRCKRYVTSSDDPLSIVNNALEWHHRFPDHKRGSSPVKDTSRYNGRTSNRW